MWLAAWKLVSNGKAHSRIAKCEAFHIAPRLFFMFLSLIPFTIRQHCIIYPQEFSTEPILLIPMKGLFDEMGVLHVVEPGVEEADLGNYGQGEE